MFRLQVGHSVAVGVGTGGFVGITGGVGVAWLQVTHGVFVGTTGGVGVDKLQFTHGVLVGHFGGLGVAVGDGQGINFCVGVAVGTQHTGHVAIGVGVANGVMLASAV